MRARLFTLCLSGLACGLFGCTSNTHPERAASGSATVTFDAVPSDVACLRIEVRGSRVAERRFDVASGAPSRVELRDLPLGKIVVEVFAYAESCDALGADSTPIWRSAPVAVKLVGGVVAKVRIRELHPEMLDPPDAEPPEAGSDGSHDAASEADASPPSDAGSDAGASPPSDAGSDAGASPPSDAGDRDAAEPPDRDDAGIEPDPVCPRSDAAPSCAPWTHVSSRGYHHGCGIAGGALYCWGRNAYGELGLGDTAPRARPTRVGLETDWEAVSAGQERTCGIRAGGLLFCWGRRGLELTASDESVRTPVQVGSDTDWRVIGVAGGYCGLRASGSLYCWGKDTYQTFGPLIPPDNQHRYFDSPQRVGASDTWTALAVGGGSACGLDGGRLYCWGSNGMGQLGNGTKAAEPQPTQVGTFSDWTDVAIASDGNRVCGIRAGGTLFCWGGFAEIKVPTLENEIDDWHSVSAALDFTCGVRSNGDGYCWGRNEHGQVGDGTVAPATSPKRLEAPTGWSRIETGYGTTFGLRDGNLYAWGTNWHGVRGTAQPPSRVGTDSDWLSVTAGATATCGLRAPGDLYCWGTATNSVEPVRVGTARDWTRISLRVGQRCGIRAGALYCWAGSSFGDPIVGPSVRFFTPTRVGNATDWADVSVGSQHACAVKTSGAATCWGSVVGAEIVDGVNGEEPRFQGLSFTQVPGMGWDRLAASEFTSCGIRDGELHCWTALDEDATILPEFMPTRVDASSQWTDVSLHASSACGIQAGALYCWGEDSYGQFGLGAPSDDPLPITRVGDSQNWHRVACHRFSTCAITTAGELLCAGSNEIGQLGTGDFIDRATFTPRTGSGWQHVTMGFRHGCGIRNGELYCWGNNFWGALGSALGLTPTQVVH